MTALAAERLRKCESFAGLWAGRFCGDPGDRSFEDLRQEAMLAMLKTIRKRGAVDRHTLYLAARTGAIDAVRKIGVSRHYYGRVNVITDSRIAEDTRSRQHEAFREIEEREAIAKTMRGMRPRERRWIAGLHKGRTQRQIASRMGVDNSRVTQIKPRMASNARKLYERLTS